MWAPARAASRGDAGPGGRQRPRLGARAGPDARGRLAVAAAAAAACLGGRAPGAAARPRARAAGWAAAALPRDRRGWPCAAARSAGVRRGAGRESVDAPLCSFGVIGDVQYSDCDDGTDFSGLQTRYFRHTLEILRRAARRWVSDKVGFIVQLGDIIDGRNAGEGLSAEALDRVLEAFPADLPRADLIGNHDLYNFPRAALRNVGVHLLAEGLPGAERVEPDRDGNYFAFRPEGDEGRWEVLCLDTYDVACVGHPDGHPKRAQAEDLLADLNPGVFVEGADWFDGLPEELHRFVPYNGAVGARQLAWLRRRLLACDEEGRKVCILSHIPIFPRATTLKTVVWNAEEILGILRSQEGRCVVAVLAGHDHEGGYAVDPETGIHHVTFLSPLVCRPGSGMTGAATVECHEHHLSIYGHGVFCAESGSRGRGFHLSHLKLKRVDPRGW